MPVITITSDFGWQDYYLAAIKGHLLCQTPEYPIVDITHNIESHDIVQAAFIFKNAWKNFPEGSIHLISVKNYYGEKKRFLAFEKKGHYFVGPDNGLFSLVFEAWPEEAVYGLPSDPDQPLPLKEVFALALRHLLSDKTFKKVGPELKDVVRRITFQPVITPHEIRGSVIYVDKYENVFVNISEVLFEQVADGRDFKVFFKRHDPIQKISQHYYEVPVGEPLCRFNSSGYLELAINMGKASSLLGLNVEDAVHISFD
jgi:S-adenosylmethionine hydrolase